MQSQSLAGQRLVTPQPHRALGPSRQAFHPTAVFGRKAKVVEPPPPPPPKKLFGFFGGKEAAQTTAPAKASKAAKSKDKAVVNDKAAEYKKRSGFLGNVTSALDFAEVRSKSDAELLYDAKYGKRGADGRMSREQYGALRRKIGGTAKDYWKDWVDVKGAYVEKGYVSTESTTVPGLPILMVTVLVLLGTTVFVVANTS